MSIRRVKKLREKAFALSLKKCIEYSYDQYAAMSEYYCGFSPRRYRVKYLIGRGVSRCLAGMLSYPDRRTKDIVVEFNECRKAAKQLS